MASMVKALRYLRWLIATAFLHLFLTKGEGREPFPFFLLSGGIGSLYRITLLDAYSPLEDLAI
jgi:hypothetical protein